MENKQIVISKFGGPEVLAIRSSEVPQPQAGQVLVKSLLPESIPSTSKLELG